MQRCQVPIVWLFALTLGAVSAPALRADDFTASAFDNATVWPTGPRPGDFGKAFFNIEGPSNGDFASFGVADFDSTTLGIDFTVGDISGVTVTLTQDNAAFTTDGVINFYITEDNVTSIQPDDSPLQYDPTNPPEGLGSQLQPLHFLGSGPFTEGPNGTVDTFPFTPDPDTVAYLASVINNGGVIRLVITANTSTVSATYAGFSDINWPGPMLTVTASPAN